MHFCEKAAKHNAPISGIRTDSNQECILQVASQCDRSHNCLKDCWVIQVYTICLKHNVIMWLVIMCSVSNWPLIYHLSQITFILFDEVVGGLLDIATINLQPLVKCW